MGGCDVDVCDFLCGFFGLMYANRDPSEDGRNGGRSGRRLI